MRIRLALPLICALALTFSVAAQAADAPRVFSFKGEDLATVKSRLKAGDPTLQKALDQLVKEADEALKCPIYSVVNKPNAPPNGDKHDYMSLSPYWHPDPDKKDGLPYIRHDGVVNPEREKYDQPVIEDFSKNVHTLGLAYYFTGDEKYATKAAQLMRAWFFDEATKMNPNCRYAQVVRGKEDQVKASGVLEGDRFRRCLDADGLLAGSSAWTTDDHAKLSAWMKQYLDYILTSEIGKAEAVQPNNHGTWYAVQASTFALFLDDKDKAKEIVEQHGKSKIKSQIEPDGKQPLELERTKAFDYSRYNLLALIQLADIGNRVGVDLWNYQTEDGRSIRKAIDWLAPFATGEKKWEHEQIYEAKTGDMFNILRRASIAYNEPQYEEMAHKIQKVDFDTSRVNLLYPKLAK